MQRTSLILRLLSVLALAVAFSGCLNTWKPVAGPVKGVAKQTQMSLPQGWAYIQFSGSKETLTTRDGPFLQAIVVDEHPLKEPLPSSKQTVDPNIGAEQLADLLLAEAQQANELSNAKMESVSPDELGGVPATRLVYSYATKEGLTYRSIVVAAIHEKHLISITYRAPVRHYFDLDKAAFESVLNQVTLL